jgi:hypothetical protein
MRVQRDFQGFTISTSYGPVSLERGASFAPFGPAPQRGALFSIASAELHNASVAFCTVRYAFKDSPERTSRWEPLSGIFAPPLFEAMPEGSSYETKVIVDGVRTRIELLTDVQGAGGGYAAKVAAWALASAAAGGAKGAAPEPPYVPVFTLFAIDVTFRGK